MVTIHHFALKIPEEKWLRYYSGEIKTILIVTTAGLTVSISAHHFRPFTTKQGLYGFFKLTLDHNNRFLNLEQLV